MDKCKIVSRSGDGVLPQYPSDDVYMNDEMLVAAVGEASRHGAFITVHARGSASVATPMCRTTRARGRPGSGPMTR
jgi:hypothetical protein